MAPWPGEKVKGRVRRGHLKYLPCPFCGSLSICPINFLCCTHKTHEGTMCFAYNFLVKKSKFKVTLVVWSFCHVCSMSLYLFYLFASSATQIQCMTGCCVTHHFHITRVASWGPDRRKWLFSEVRGGIWTPHSPVLIKISADKRPLNQLTVKNLFFSLFIKTFCL